MTCPYKCKDKVRVDFWSTLDRVFDRSLGQLFLRPLGQVIVRLLGRFSDCSFRSSSPSFFLLAFWSTSRSASVSFFRSACRSLGRFGIWGLKFSCWGCSQRISQTFVGFGCLTEFPKDSVLMCSYHHPLMTFGEIK